MALTKTAAISDASGDMLPPIRDAASTILWRDGLSGIEVLMGQRGQAASFMPSKFVFPGGRVEADDSDHADDSLLAPLCLRRLRLSCAEHAASPLTLAGAALRELAEETGLRLRMPAPQAMRYVFRAITPPGAPRRFDARFFLLHATSLETDKVDGTSPDNELSQLQWVSIADSRKLDLPFITGIVLEEVEDLILDRRDDGVPFFDTTHRPTLLGRLV